MERKDLFKFLINILDKNNIEYALVGRTESYPYTIGSDIDIIIHKYDIPKFKKIIWDIEDENIKIAQMLQHEIVAFYYVIFYINKKDSQILYIQPDVCSDYYRKGRKLLTANYLLKNRIEAPQKGFYILSPEKEFIYYLLKKIDKLNLTKEHFEHLLNCYKKKPEECLKECISFWNSKSINLIKDAFEQNNINLLNKNLYYLQNNIHTSKPIRFIDGIKNILLKIKRVIYPTGYIIAFMGPDGSGKTTVINKFKEDIQPAFRNINQYHLFPIPGKNGNVTNTNPQAQRKRGIILSICKLIYLVLLYNYAYLRFIIKPYVKSTLIIFDRYYDDILIDSKRYRNSAPDFLVKFFGYFIPKPKIWVILDAPTDVIQERKAEVTYEETERQRNSYKNFAKGQNNSIIVSTDRDINDISIDICKYITEYLNIRITKRQKK